MQPPQELRTGAASGQPAGSTHISGPGVPGTDARLGSDPVEVQSATTPVSKPVFIIFSDAAMAVLII